MPRELTYPVDLAAKALQRGWTRQTVIQRLCARVERDKKYLERRRQQGQITAFDAVLEEDIQASALAACYLVDDEKGAIT